MSNFRVAYPVGNTPGRDHQFWPTATRDELRAILVAEFDVTEPDAQNRIFDNGWPVGVTLDVLMMMAWRVREWTMETSSFSYTGIEAMNPSLNWNITGTLPEFALKMRRRKRPIDTDNPMREVTDELDILGPASDPFDIGEAPVRWQTLRNCGVNGRAVQSEIILTGSSSHSTFPFLDPPYLEPGGDYFAQIFGEFPMSEFSQYVIFDPDTNLFYPRFSAGGRFERLIGTVDNSSGAAVEIYCLPVTPTTISPETPQGNFTITNPIIGEPDIVIPLGMRGEPAGVHPPFWQGGTGSVELAMSPTAFWPYENSLHQPVWDVDTGTQLVSPFS